MMMWWMSISFKVSKILERRAQRQVGQEDEVDLFGRQVAATLCHLAKRQKAMVKVPIQHLLVGAEFPDEPQESSSYYVGY